MRAGGSETKRWPESQETRRRGKMEGVEKKREGHKGGEGRKWGANTDNCCSKEKFPEILSP